MRFAKRSYTVTLVVLKVTVLLFPIAWLLVVSEPSARAVPTFTLIEFRLHLRRRLKQRFCSTRLALPDSPARVPLRTEPVNTSGLLFSPANSISKPLVDGQGDIRCLRCASARGGYGYGVATSWRSEAYLTAPAAAAGAAAHDHTDQNKHNQSKRC
jgi:hypothetical protein